MRLLRWILFSVFVSLIPLLLHWVVLLGQEKPLSGVWTAVLAHGELLLISTAIAADAIGDMVASGLRNEVGKVLAGGGCVLSLLFAALWYATNATMMDMGQPVKAQIMAEGSVAIFVMTVLAGGSCKWLAKE
jgi:hypothetical protein